jgi:hypothetical protein
VAKKKTDLDDLHSVLVGISGEYFVAAELSRLGYIASITLRNTRGIDILATNAAASQSAEIQVKTSRDRKKDWMMNAKGESYHSPTHFYVFVNLNGPLERPSFHVVPSEIVARYIHDSHRKWLATPNKKGGKHTDTPMRRFKDPTNQYLDRWDLLGL